MSSPIQSGLALRGEKKAEWERRIISNAAMQTQAFSLIALILDVHSCQSNGCIVFKRRPRRGPSPSVEEDWESLKEGL